MPNSLLDYYYHVLGSCRNMRNIHTYSFAAAIYGAVFTAYPLFQLKVPDPFSLMVMIVSFAFYRYTKPFKSFFYSCINKRSTTLIQMKQDQTIENVCLPNMAYSPFAKKEITNEMYCDLEEYINNMPNDQIERHVFEEIRGYVSTLMQTQGCILYKDLGRILIHIGRKKAWIIHNNECVQASEIKDSLLNNDRANTSAEPENRIDERAPEKLKGWRKIDYLK